MKKSILIYNLTIYSICFIISTVQLLTASFTLEVLFLIIFSLLFLIPIYCIFVNKHLKQALISLAIINLIQTFSFIFLGLTYKLIIGPDLSFYLIDSGDFSARFSMKIFNIYSYFNYVNKGDTFALGINFIHLIMFVYFYLEAKKG